jgi:DNA-binding NtrC family response regulator
MPTKSKLQQQEKKNILIIEDEGEMCLLLNILLDDAAMELDHVQNLSTATEFLKKKTPSIIILDNKLPDGLGVDYVPYLKKEYPGVRVIMISGFGGSAKDLALKNGADIFMEKPFSRDQLFQSIDTLLN